MAKKEPAIREIRELQEQKICLDSSAVYIFCIGKCPVFDNGPNLLSNTDLGQGGYERCCKKINLDVRLNLQ